MAQDSGDPTPRDGDPPRDADRPAADPSAGDTLAADPPGRRWRLSRPRACALDLEPVESGLALD